MEEEIKYEETPLLVSVKCQQRVKYVRGLSKLLEHCSNYCYRVVEQVDDEKEELEVPFIPPPAYQPTSKPGMLIVPITVT